MTTESILVWITEIQNFSCLLVLLRVLPLISVSFDQAHIELSHFGITAHVLTNNLQEQNNISPPQSYPKGSTPAEENCLPLFLKTKT